MDVTFDSAFGICGIDGMGNSRCSLRSAIIAANDNDGLDTITFANNLTGTISLLLGELRITESVTITGPGQDVLTVDANRQSRVLNVIGGTQIDVTLQGLTFTGGRTTANGEGDGGGGIRFDSTGTLTLAGSTISGNSASGTGGGLNVIGFFGIPGILGGPVVLQDVTFEDNTAGLSGGGAYLRLVASVDIVDSRLQGNTTAEAGGGLYLLDTGPVLISQSDFDGNTAIGGGVAILTDATIEDSLFRSNMATAVATAFDEGGGGISIAQDSTVSPSVTILRSSILDNRAPLDGGIGSANANLTITDIAQSGVAITTTHRTFSRASRKSAAV